jgi:phenylpyruvate tautomerase PptA (4-oxalocrotonate tautomerase family)
MSTARVYVPTGALTLEQRRAIIKGIHEVINTVEKRPPEAQTHTYVIVTEVPSGNWGSDGALYAPKT